MTTYKDATVEEINTVMENSWLAFEACKKFSLKQRAGFMHAIADALDTRSETLVATAMKETHLPKDRLEGELTRTLFQLNSYANAAREGSWLEARIDTAIPDRTPAKPDLRKMLVPLGPVVVFGSSNFPFAYSTAGGDTACALAAGCPVVVKAHPAHAETSEMVAAIITETARKAGMPEKIFQHVHGAGFAVGEALVMHPRTKAVGFTGSFSGGKALFDRAAQRREPIPVFAEMGSVNPVYLLPEKLKESPETIAEMYAQSVTLSVGQFCTNPGLIIGMDNEYLQKFIRVLGREIEQIAPATMLHPGIAKAYAANRSLALQQEEVSTVAAATQEPLENQGVPTIASATGEAFLKNPVLHKEIFGPFSLVVRCRDMDEMTAIAAGMEGQLTGTLMGTEADMLKNNKLVEAVKNTCGRIIVNGVPTGVEVCLSMQHGGPFPATTDPRFTSVGADGIKRFARPVCFQNWPNTLLPDELKDANPLGIWRTVNDDLTKEGTRIASDL